MRLAVISDVHSNLAALEAVTRDLQSESPDLVVCLGDLVGYNAEPKETIERVQSLTQCIVLGNHDRDAARINAAPGTHAAARQAQTWTSEQLSASERDFLTSLPNRWIEPDAFVAVHGCYLNDTHYNGYVTSTMLEANLKAIASRVEWPKLAFAGHTHAPMCGFRQLGHVHEFNLAESAEWPRSADAVLINPGAVGQPRDGNPRACYAVVDLVERHVRVKRVEYDVERTARGILQAGLPPELADRLRRGR